MVLLQKETETEKKLPATPWGQIPPRMSVLLVTGSRRIGGWLADALASDSAAEVALEEVVGMAAGLARLREHVFDAVLVSYEPEEFDALDLAETLRTGSRDEQPVLILGSHDEQQLAALCYEAGADAYVYVPTTTVRTLIWKVSRAIERHQLIVRNRQLLAEHRHRLQQEHAEAERLLEQQRALVANLSRLCRDAPLEDDFQPAEPSPNAAIVSESRFPPRLVEHYRELLTTYVIMGSGNLAEEMNALVEQLSAAGMAAQQALSVHVQVLEDMVRDLGSRSARHVMNRADILALEVMIHLAEDYRRRYLAAAEPLKQVLLPGFSE